MHAVMGTRPARRAVLLLRPECRIRNFGQRSASAPACAERRLRFSVLRSRLLKLETSVVCDADKVNDASHPTGLATLAALDPGIAPLNPQSTMAGLARTVQTRGDEFLTVLHALCEAEQGEVIVIATQGGRAPTRVRSSRRRRCGRVWRGL